jgi:uncharacterized FlaG/YvyC family protein
MVGPQITLKKKERRTASNRKEANAAARSNQRKNKQQLQQTELRMQRQVGHLQQQKGDLYFRQKEKQPALTIK